MREETNLRLAGELFALYLQELADNIVSESLKLSDVIVRSFNSNAFVSVSMEACAFLLHHLSRGLPTLDHCCPK